MDDTPTQALDEEAQVAAGLPERIGPYRILGLLGEGGMGRVYLAQESHPQREVALKVVRGVSASALERFRREIDVLAQLEHPGIVRLYAAGEDAVGGMPAPWFALEVVRGPELHVWLGRTKPDLATRVRLLVKLARAVHHAHQRGIVHRDLKPSNVLVDEHGQPKILDFGIARLHGEAGGDMTQAGQVMGTLPYMSPEQLAGQGHEADARSDVYALGAIGYELIAGRLPHPRLSTSTLFEALDIMRREDPPTLESLASDARGDLSTVVMKALAGEPGQRYASAAEFADDLEAVLEHRPIRARAPTWSYRAARFVRRNRALTVAASVVFVALLIATIVSALAAQRARAALAEAESRAKELAAVNGFVETMLTEADPEMGGSVDMPLREVLERAEQALEDRSASPRTEGQVALLLGRAWSGLGESARAQGILDRAQKWLDAGFGPNSAEAFEARYARMEDAARASEPERVLTEVDVMERQLAAIDADWARALLFRTRLLRAQSLEEAGDVEGGIRLGRELLADPLLPALPNADEHIDSLRHNLAYALNNSGGFDEAEKLLRETLASESKRLGADHAQTLYTKKTLGQTLHRQGRLEDAVALYKEVYEKRGKLYSPDHPLTLGSGMQLASAYNTLDRAAEAEPLLRRALDGYAARGDGEGADAIIARVMFANTLDRLGRHDQAIAIAGEVIALEREKPSLHTAASYNIKAVALLAQGRQREARQAWGDALRVVQEVGLTGHPNYSSILGNAGHGDLVAGDAQAARVKLETALDLLKAKQGPQHPRTREVAGWLMEAYGKLGLDGKAAALRAEFPPEPADNPLKS